MNAADRRKAKRRAFRQGRDLRTRMAQRVLKTADALEYRISAQTLAGMNPYRLEGNRYGSAYRRRQIWGDFTKQLALEFDRGWGPL